MYSKNANELLPVLLATFSFQMLQRLKHLATSLNRKSSALPIDSEVAQGPTGTGTEFQVPIRILLVHCKGSERGTSCPS